MYFLCFTLILVNYAIDSLPQGLGCAYRGKTSTGAWEQFWPDALPVATNDSYGYQQGLNPRSPVALTTES